MSRVDEVKHQRSPWKQVVGNPRTGRHQGKCASTHNGKLVRDTGLTPQHRVDEDPKNSVLRNECHCSEGEREGRNRGTFSEFSPRKLVVPPHPAKQPRGVPQPARHHASHRGCRHLDEQSKAELQHVDAGAFHVAEGYCACVKFGSPRGYWRTSPWKLTKRARSIACTMRAKVVQSSCSYG